MSSPSKTSIYAALYKTTSPLTLDWRTEEVAEMLGKDEQLIQLFCNVKTEMYWFCKYQFYMANLLVLNCDRRGKRSTIL